MGILSSMRLGARVASGSLYTPKPIASPFSDSQLKTIAWSDVLGLENVPVTRLDAMRVSAIAKGRSVIVGTLSAQPLSKWQGARQVEAEPWMYRTSTAVSPLTRMLWTLDDLIFYGVSLWQVTRGPADEITDAWRVPPEDWEVTPDLAILVDSQPVSAEQVVYIEGPQEGLVEIGSEDIKAARAMTRAWANRVQTPIPTMELHITDQMTELTDAEQDALIAAWETARTKGGTALTPAGIETKVHGQVVADLYVQGRNAARIDVANFLNLPVALLDGSPATASLTYSTKEGSRNDLVDISLRYWATAIEARLSMDDVVPAGTRVAFDVEYLALPVQPTSGPVHHD